jgi:hypothetical protein
MRSQTFLLLASALSSSWIGCEPRETPTAVAKPAPGAQPLESAFSSRYEAAKDIFDSTARDEALSKVALDAAAAGDGDTTMKALQAMLDSARKDQAASKSALGLGKYGRGAEANTVARWVLDASLRDLTLSKLAKGEYKD